MLRHNTSMSNILAVYGNDFSFKDRFRRSLLLVSLADHFERFTDSSIHNLQQHKMLLEEMNTSLELQKSFSTPCILVILIKSIWLSLKTLEVLIPTKYFCFLRKTYSPSCGSHGLTYATKSPFKS